MKSAIKRYRRQLILPTYESLGGDLLDSCEMMFSQRSRDVACCYRGDEIRVYLAGSFGLARVLMISTA